MTHPWKTKHPAGSAVGEYLSMNDETGPFDQPKNCASITMRQIFLKDYIMHRTPLILIALIGMLCCLAHEANADSRQGQGIILTVNDDD